MRSFLFSWLLAPPSPSYLFYYNLLSQQNQLTRSHTARKSGGPAAVVKPACLENRRLWARSPLWHSSFKETKCFFPAHSWWFNIVESLRDREVACSASDRQGSNFEFCVWRAVSSHHPQEFLLAQFSLHVYKGGLKHHSFNFIPLQILCL